MIEHVMRWITARFAPQGPQIQGSCNQCGHCCRNLLLYDGTAVVSNEQQFQHLLRRRPIYAIYEPCYQDLEDGILYFSCRHIGADNRCGIYHQRPAICRDYPNPRMFLHGARLPEPCSYELSVEDRFANTLQQHIDRLK